MLDAVLVSGVLYWRAHTPTTTTSYFSSSLSSRLNGGASRGSGGANDGRTLKSRDEEECSVKTGIAFWVLEADRSRIFSYWKGENG